MSWNILAKFLVFCQSRSGEPWLLPPRELCCFAFLFTIAVTRWYAEPQKGRLHLSHWQSADSRSFVLSHVFSIKIGFRLHYFFPLRPYKCLNCIHISNYKVNMTSKKGNCLFPETCLYYGFFKHEAFNKPSACSISFPSDETLPHGLHTPSPWLTAAACLCNLPRVVSSFPPWHPVCF